MVFFLVVLPPCELLHFFEDLFAGLALLEQLVDQVPEGTNNGVLAHGPHVTRSPG